MTKTPAEFWLARVQPLMAEAANRVEFNQHLQWLSEGVLHARIEPNKNSLLSDFDRETVAQQEITDYRMFCELRSYGKHRAIIKGT